MKPLPLLYFWFKSSCNRKWILSPLECHPTGCYLQHSSLSLIRWLLTHKENRFHFHISHIPGCIRVWAGPGPGLPSHLAKLKENHKEGETVSGTARIWMALSCMHRTSLLRFAKQTQKKTALEWINNLTWLTYAHAEIKLILNPFLLQPVSPSF